VKKDGILFIGRAFVEFYTFHIEIMSEMRIFCEGQDKLTYCMEENILYGEIQGYQGIYGDCKHHDLLRIKETEDMFKEYLF